ECLAEPVQERPAHEDRDAGGAGVGVDVDAVGDLDVGRVDVDRSGILVPFGVGAVEVEEVGDDLYVLDGGNVLQLRGGLPQHCRNHRFGDEVLRPTHGNLTIQWHTAMYTQNTHSRSLPGSRICRIFVKVAKCRGWLCPHHDEAHALVLRKWHVSVGRAPAGCRPTETCRLRRTSAWASSWCGHNHPRHIANFT